MEGESTCNCQRCGNPIVFQIDLHNTDAVCPVCGKETTLQVPRIRPAAPAQVRQPIPQTFNVSAQPAEDLKNLILAGRILTVLFPLGGFIIGFILLSKNRVGIGTWCVVGSILFAIIYSIFFSALTNL